jgi:hypothetical protein
LRQFTIIPSALLSRIWTPHPHTEKSNIPDIVDYSIFARNKFAPDPATIADVYYIRAQTETRLNEAGQGMFPTWILEIPSISSMIGKKVHYCVEPELFGSTILWYGLPCKSRTIIPESIANPDHPHFIGKAMIGVVKLKLHEISYEWIVSLACGRICKIPHEYLRTILSADLHRPAHKRFSVVTRTTPKGKKIDIPYMPASFHFVISPSETKLDSEIEIEIENVSASGDMAASASASVSVEDGLRQDCPRIANNRLYRMTIRDGVKIGSSWEAQLNGSGISPPSTENAVVESKKQKGKLPPPAVSEMESSAQQNGDVDMDANVSKKRRKTNPVESKSQAQTSKISASPVSVSASAAESRSEVVSFLARSCEKKQEQVGTEGIAKIPNILCPYTDADSAKRKEWYKTFIEFLRYYEHYLRHVPRVQTQFSDAPQNGNLKEMIKHPDFPEVLRIFTCTFY